ncbi:MAG TPA: GAF and ANTAR domain-containing protein [Frankiaceae bacterium]|nr:GAF and ANTAR domain-containing protein [Frankiaceae bacterium]
MPSIGDDLTAALYGLSQLVPAQGSLETTLTRIAEFAVQAIPHADGAGLTLLRGDARQTVVASDQFVRAIDDVQYAIAEGPCITAVEENRVVLSGSLGGDPQWPHFGPRIGRMGVHSALSLPLTLSGEAVGALNVYAYRKDAFDPEAARLAELFARPAAAGVVNAQVLTDLKQTVSQLQEALTTRATIDQAIGLIMSRTGASSAEAFDRLRNMSQRSKAKVSLVAQQILDEAVGRARARRKGREPEPDEATAGRLN